MESRRTTILIGGLFLVVLLVGFIGYNIYQAIWAATQPVLSVSDRLATSQAALLPQPTPTIYPDGATVIRAIQPLARMETVQYTIEKVIVAESNQGPLGFLFGDKLLLVAHGTVIAGVDLSKLRADDIEVLDDGRVIVTIPPAEIFIATLDNDETFVYDRDTGILTRGDINLETAARQAAEDEIETAALEDGILQTADENARATITQLILALGFEEVLFVEATPTR